MKIHEAARRLFNNRRAMSALLTMHLIANATVKQATKNDRLQALGMEVFDADLATMLNNACEQLYKTTASKIGEKRLEQIVDEIKASIDSEIANNENATELLQAMDGNVENMDAAVELLRRFRPNQPNA